MKTIPDRMVLGKPNHKMEDNKWLREVASSDYSEWQVEERDSPVHCSCCGYTHDNMNEDRILLNNPELPRVLCFPCYNIAVREAMMRVAKRADNISIGD